MWLKTWIDIFNKLKYNQSISIYFHDKNYEAIMRTHPIYVSALLAFYAKEVDKDITEEGFVLDKHRVLSIVDFLKKKFNQNLVEIFIWGKEEDLAIQVLKKRFTVTKHEDLNHLYNVSLAYFDIEWLDSLAHFDVMGFYISNHSITVINRGVYKKKIPNYQLPSIAKIIQDISFVQAEEIVLGHVLMSLPNDKRNELINHMESPFMKSVIQVEFDLMDKSGQYKWYHRRFYPIRELMMTIDIQLYNNMNYQNACRIFMKE